MNLLETLSLALSLECNLELKGEKIIAKPKANVTDELRDGIKENRDAMVEHLKKVEEEEGYALIDAIARAGIELVYDKEDNLKFARPSAAVMAYGLRERIARFKPWLSGVKKAREEGIRSEAEFILMARERFPDREPWERPLSKEEFFYGKRKRVGA
jgi:hypothetical protein